MSVAHPVLETHILVLSAVYERLHQRVRASPPAAPSAPKGRPMGDALLAAAQRGDALEVARLVQSGARLRYAKSVRACPAARRCPSAGSAFSPLLAAFASLQDGNRALHLAAQWGHAETIEVLTDLKAGVDAENSVCHPRIAMHNPAIAADHCRVPLHRGDRRRF